MFLTNYEVQVLTGYARLSAQRRWLTANNIPFVVGGDRKAKVLRQVIKLRLAGAVSTASCWEPQLRF
ncbi:DUF4224 domain-containing protein [Stutzerimonas stutzeri]|uniref:DUF4224 domain-containing protein n=1 Tax=Stutzerimonas stutzeri TaxID=316 RepID=UPI0015E2F9B8|nr:DUF4224 domain-containing protein [Stutzerimonas stutzeri]MBA1278119.1 DUF4224 domain-containing protein [Stutzerimonas stutzeri]